MRASTTEAPEARGYGFGATDVVLSVDEVERAAGELATERLDANQLERLCTGSPFVAIDRLVAGYGRMEILHWADEIAAREPLGPERVEALAAA